jgi:hypothetical protein
VFATTTPSQWRRTTTRNVAPDISPRATCPLCHTIRAPLTQEAIEVGSGWRCGRCGQQWDAGRLAVVAAYTAWTVEHDRLTRNRKPPGRQGAPVSKVDVAMKSDNAIATWDNEGGRSSLAPARDMGPMATISR